MCCRLKNELNVRFHVCSKQICHEWSCLCYKITYIKKINFYEVLRNRETYRKQEWRSLRYQDFYIVSSKLNWLSREFVWCRCPWTELVMSLSVSMEEHPLHNYNRQPVSRVRLIKNITEWKHWMKVICLALIAPKVNSS